MLGKIYTLKSPRHVAWYLILLCVLCTLNLSAQVTVTNPGNTTPGLSATYVDLATVVGALNAQTAISGPVTITLDPGNPQTSPAGGYAITAILTGASSVNTVTLEGSGNTITAPTPAGAAGNLNDAIFKFIGSDFMTLQNFIMNENGANTTTTAASNNMIEWGVALLYATTTNGAQNITIQNNTITLNRTYQNTFGIYSNSTHSATAPTSTVSASTAAGGNSGLKIYTNNISNVNEGIVVVGPTGAVDYNTGIDIGGSSLSQGNTISNYGTTGTFSSYANVSGTVYGILVRNNIGYNVSYNSITSSAGGTTSGTLRGIYNPAASNTPSGTFSNTINNNTIALTYGVATGTMQGITVESGNATITSSISISNNNFTAMTASIASSVTITCIANASPYLTTNINSNTFTNISTITTGTFTFINNSLTRPANAVCNVNTNGIVTAFNKTGTGGGLVFYTSNGTTPSTGTETNSGNNFSNVTLAGLTTSSVLWGSTDGSTSAPFGPGKTVTNNTFSNLNFGAATASATILTVAYSNSGLTTNNVSGNTIGPVTSGNVIIGISSQTASQNFFNNTVSGLSSTGAIAVTGMAVTGGTVQNVFKNKICDLQSNNAFGTCLGISCSGSTTNQQVNIFNNLIGDLRAIATTSTSDAVRGISITGLASTGTYNVSFNTVYLNATSNVGNFSTSGIFHTVSTTATTGTLNLRNNIIVNNSIPSGTGTTVAFRRSAGAANNLANYGSVSDRNLFYAGTPDATHLIYSDGTSVGQSLSDYKNGIFTAGTIAPRDANSITENPTFVSTSCSNSTFLHIVNTSPTAIESAGANIAGITDDYDANIRAGNGGYSGTGTAPDIGADEFELILASCSGAVGGTASGSTSFCGSGTPAITAAGFSTGSGSGYQWMSSTNSGDYPGSGTPVGGQTNPSSLATGVVSTTTYYWLMVTCTTGTAVDYSTMVTVTINPSLASISPPSASICAGESVTLNENGGTGTSWSWSPGGATTQSITVNPASTTSYTVTVTSPGPCTATASATVTVTPLPTTTGNTICAGGSGTIAATSPCVILTPSGTTISGTWTAGTDPVALRLANPFLNASTCSFNATITRNYVIHQFQVSLTGNYVFEMNNDAAFDGMGYITTGAFVPGNCAGGGTFVRGDDDDGVVDNEPRIGAVGVGAGALSLTAGVTYTLVSTTWATTSGTYSGPFTWTVTPPVGGQILLLANGLVEWYDAAVNGNLVGTGTPFNPVPGGIPNTNTPGTYTFYAACSANNTCRTATNFIINDTPTITGTPTDETCPGANDGTITTSVTGGTGPYNCEWIGPDMSVAVVTKTAAHPYFGTGSALGFTIDGVEGKELTLVRGVTYNFVINNPGHPFYISTDADGAGAGEVLSGVTGSQTDFGVLTFTPDAGHPNLLYYQCWNHLNMGWIINIIDGQTGCDLSGLMPGEYDVTVTDASGCIGLGSFNIDPGTDNTDPVVTCPADIVQCDIDVATYTATATDNCTASPVVTCVPPSGSSFATGTTTVTCSADDDASNTGSCSFSVTINESPVIGPCPSDINTSNPVVTYATPGATGTPSPTVTCAPASGSTFATGTTVVTCTATNSCGNSTCTFNVTVTGCDPSTDPTSATSNAPYGQICLGGNVTLTVNGGSLGTNATWEWYEGGCGTGGSIGTGASVTIMPATNGAHVYYVRAEGDCGITNCVTVTVNVTSAPPSGTVHYTASIADGCVSSPAATFSVNAVSGATFYRWTSAQAGVRFNGNPGPFETTVPTVNVTFVSLPASGSSGWSICVFAGNACGNSNSICTWVRATVSMPAAITGSVIGCPGSSGNNYSVPAVTGAVSYQWSGTNGMIINNNGSQNIQVTFPIGFTTGVLSVHGQTACGYNGPDRNLTINSTPPIPGSINGTSYPCPNGTSAYSVAPVAGAVSYTWSTSVPGAIVTGTTNTVSIQFPGTIPAGSTVSVVANSSCPTSSAVRSKGIATGLPSVPVAISGPASGQCGQTGVSYSVTPVAIATSYLWSTSCGTINGPNNLSAVSIDWPASFSTCLLSVSAVNACGTGGARTLTVSAVPSTPAAISGNAAPCAGAIEGYTTTGSTGATSYTWTLPAGASFIGPSSGNSISVQWGSTSGSITVKGNNACGSSAVRSLACVISCRIAQVNAAGGFNAEVYPNPVTDKTTVKFNATDAGSYKIILYDVIGNEMLSTEGTTVQGDNMVELNLAAIAKGMYMLSLISNGSSEQIRVVVE